jgi:hypothetical protein
MPIIISEKDRKFIERSGPHRFLTTNEIKELMERCKNEVKEKFKKDPDILEKSPDFVVKTFKNIFVSEKILLTNFKEVWDIYDNPESEDPDLEFRTNFKNFSRKLSKGFWCGGSELEYKFILLLEDPKEVRNIKLRIKRRKRREQGITRVCKECDHKFQAVHRDAIFCSKSCKMRDYRRRKKEVMDSFPGHGGG